MQSKITKRAVDAVQAVPARDVWLWDAELKGFGLRVRSNGAKSYVLEYRPGAGGRSAPKRRVTIGRHGSPWTPDTARREARRLLGAVANGGDPAAEKSDHKGAPTVAQMTERFLAEHVNLKRKASTAKEYRRLLSQFVVPKVGRKRVVDVVRRDMMNIHGGLVSTPYQANRVLAVSSALFNFAILAGEPPKQGNPTAGIEPFPEKSRERLLSPRELAWLGEAMADAERAAEKVADYEREVAAVRRQFGAARAINDRKAGGLARRQLAKLRAQRPLAAVPPQALACFRLLFFTGARLTEILTLQLPWVNFERGEARLPDSKTERKTVFLAAPALDVLARVPQLADNPYVITGERLGSHFVGIQRPWRQIREAATVKAWASGGNARAEALVRGLAGSLEREPTFAECRAAAEAANLELPTELSDLRIHDLRHAFASVAAASGMGLPIIGKMLGHTQPSTTQRYAHLAPDPVRAANAAVASQIASGLGGDIQRGEVVELSRRAGR